MDNEDKERFDKLVEAHKQANNGAKQIQEATNVLTIAGFDTQRISFSMIELAKAFRANLKEIAEQAKAKSKVRAEKEAKKNV